MSREGVLDEKRGEAQSPEHQVLHGLIAAVDGQRPGDVGFCGRRFGRPGGGLQDFVADIEDVDPVEQLALAVRPRLDGLEDPQEGGLVSGRGVESFDEGLAIGRHLRRTFLQLGPIDFHVGGFGSENGTKTTS